MLIQVATVTTGAFEDTSNSDTIAAGDTANWKLQTTGVDTNAFVPTLMGADLYSASAVLPYANGAGNTSLVAATYYNAIGGTYISRNTTESFQQFKAEQSGAISGLTIAVRANTLTATTTIVTRINGGDGTVTASITSGATGVFTDVVHSDTVAASDLINCKYTMGGTGTSMTTRQGSFVFTPSTGGVKDIIQMGIIPFARA